MHRLPLATTILAAGLLAASYGCNRPSVADVRSEGERTTRSSASVVRVTAGPPERKALQLFTSQPARVQAFEETPLYPKVTGYVEEILVDIGDPVKVGQVLLKLWVPEMQDDRTQKQALVDLAQAQVRQAEAAVSVAGAAVESAEANVALAEAGKARADADQQRWKSEHSRIEQLAASGSVTTKLVDETLNQLRAAEAGQSEVAAQVQSVQAALQQARVLVEKAEADREAAEAQLRVTRADLARCETMLAYAELRAPFDGVVTRRHVDSGHFVQPANGGSKPLLVVARTDKVRVAIAVPEMQAPLVDAGEGGDPAQVRVQSLGNGQFNGRVARTAWSLDESNRSLRVEIDIPNPDGVLRPGMYATASVLLDERQDALTLPASAIVFKDDKAFCCLVSDGKIDLCEIQLGLRSGDDFEILSGLDPQATVVLTRADALKQDQAVEVLAAEKSQ